MSSRTIIYKGMLRSCDLSLFYKDLKDINYETTFAIYHRRFSTNTVPKWYLAQPFRYVAHNGEINTLLGNINWVKSKQYAKRKIVESTQMGTFIEAEDIFAMKDGKIALGPLVDVGRSDSANLDSILENYIRAGKTPEEALMILVPEVQYMCTTSACISCNDPHASHQLLNTFIDRLMLANRSYSKKPKFKRSIAIMNHCKKLGMVLHC